MKSGPYKHYKGSVYTVVGVVLHTETQEKMVLYYSSDYPELFDEYGDPTYFIRPYNMFNETVLIEGKEIRRFEFVGDL